MQFIGCLDYTPLYPEVDNNNLILKEIRALRTISNMTNNEAFKIHVNTVIDNTIDKLILHSNLDNNNNLNLKQINPDINISNTCEN